MLEVVKWDERFSTKAVERILDDKLTWRAKRKVVDKLVATYILQGYLDYMI
ncbi:Holliday junction resolvase RuvX [Thermoanaerobacter kivui]|nr:Holliday junction resolvase RuvX [Thermoanaerobacter kivui]